MFMRTREKQKSDRSHPENVKETIAIAALNKPSEEMNRDRRSS